MPFTGKATYSAGPTLPELAEDVGDIVGIVSPYETPLLDHLGDPRRGASSTVHEWLEDTLLPNTDVVSDATLPDPLAGADFDVAHGDRFRPGDQVRIDDGGEIVLVTQVAGDTLSVTRAYGGTTASLLADGGRLTILGNAAIEGDDAPAARFTNRVRKSNYTQIFTASVEVSGSQLAARQLAVSDEMDYQKQERLRELVRDLENCVLNGIAPGANPQGDASTRRTMRGIIPSIQSNAFISGQGGFPAGDTIDSVAGHLSEQQINTALRLVWEQSSASIDTLVVGGLQKRRINGFIASNRRYDAGATRFRDLVSAYESDFGVCRVVLCRWMPSDAVLLLDSSRLDVLPLTGRSFHFKPLAETGDRASGQVIGEYTLEMRNENAHALIRGLAA